LTILPMGDVDARFVAKDCKKLVRLVALPVPPRSETRVSKLVCKELSAEVVESVEAVELVEPLVSEAMRLCTSAANPVPELEPVPDAALQLESESELVLVPSALLEFDWAWSAAMRVCMKFWKAAAILEDDEALEVDEVDPLVLVVLVEDVLVAADVVEAAELAVVADVAPIEASASNTADTRPSPGGGGGGALLELVLEVPPALVLWFCWDSMVDKADNGMVSPWLVTELILI
jgi:hypothetical protein